MNPLEKSLALLQKYLKETPKEVLQQEFDEFNQAHFEGVTIHEYFRLFEQHYWSVSPTIVEPVSIPAIETIWNPSIDKIVIAPSFLVKCHETTPDNYAGNYNYAMAA
jgi:hypothetical protein